jgi:hypothetical protein
MVTESAATTSLVGAQTGLTAVPPLIKNVHDPVSRALIEVRKIDEQISKVESDVDSFDEFNRNLSNMVSLTERLGKFVPVIGGVLSTISQIISKSGVSNAIKGAIQQLKDLIKKVRVENRHLRPDSADHRN